jgi:uncharacterized protein YndB with AHSA1/START domain
LKEHLPRRTELVVTRTIDGPPPTVFEAWTDADLLWRWWVPKSLGVPLLSCEVDARDLEVTLPSRLVSTKEEGDGGHVMTTASVVTSRSLLSRGFWSIRHLQAHDRGDHRGLAFRGAHGGAAGCRAASTHSSRPSIGIS